MKIAIEGMDGVGKSTIARKLASDYNMIYLEKPLTGLFDTNVSNGKDVLREVSNKIYSSKDEALKAWFFGLGNLYSFIEYENEDVVIDRHFASNYFWNGTQRSNTIFKSMIELIGVPNLTIVLTASIQSRMERLYKRNPNDYDLADMEKHVKGDDKMINFLREFNIPFVEVNTDNKNVDEVYEEVRNIVNEKRNVMRLVKKC